MATAIQKYDEIIENYIKFSPEFSQRDYMVRSTLCSAMADIPMTIARMGLTVDEVGVKYTKEEKKKGCQLHEAARNEDHVLALQLLQSDPNLMFYSVDGNTVLHVAAMHGNKSFVKKLIEFIKEKPLVYTSKKSPYIILNDDADTALHLALKFKHKELASDLIKELPEYAMNTSDEMMPVLPNNFVCMMNTDEMMPVMPNDFVYAMNANEMMPVMLAVRAGYSDLVREMFKRAPWTTISPDLRAYLRNSTIVYDAIDTNNLGMLQIVMDNMDALAAETTSRRRTPLIYAVNKGYVETVQYFLKKFPNSITISTYKGKFPIHEAIEVDNIDIVKEILSRYPEAMNQVYTNRFMIGGWRTLSYATYMGRLSIVRYMLTKFPDYATISDPDEYFPIHWTFGIHADESVEFLKEFITRVPKTLYQVTERGETILHLVVCYTRPEYLSYLKTLPDLYKIFHYKDVDRNTFLNLMKQEMKSYYKSHPEARKTFFKRMKEGLGRKFKSLV